MRIAFVAAAGLTEAVASASSRRSSVGLVDAAGGARHEVFVYIVRYHDLPCRIELCRRHGPPISAGHAPSCDSTPR
jgi:hypothetical protein